MNRIMKSVTFLLVTILIVGTIIPVSNVQATQEMETQTKLIANNFEISEDQLVSLTEEKIKELANVPTSLTTVIEADDIADLKEGKEGDSIPIRISSENELVEVFAMIVKSSEVMEESKALQDAETVESQAQTTEITPSTIVTTVDQAVTLEVVDYESAVGMDNSQIYTVKVKVDFGDDNTSPNKKLVFTLPEGLRFIQIPVSGSYSTVGVDSALLAQLNPTDPLATAIKSVTLPKVEKSPMSNTFGNVTYDLDAGTKLATFEFKIKVDNKRFYKAMEIPEALVAKASLAGTDIGQIEQKVNVKGYLIGSNNLGLYITQGTSVELVPSTADTISYGYAQTMRTNMWMNASPLDESVRYVKSAKYYIYYPVGMKYESVTGLNGTVENDEANSRIIVTVPSWSGAPIYRIRYSVPLGVTSGTFENAHKDYVEMEFYDGTIQTSTSTATHHKVTIVTDIVNRMVLFNNGTAYYDGSVGGDSYVYGSFFRLENTATAGKKTNQFVHFNFGQNWQVKKIHIPFDSTVAGNIIKDVVYKTNKHPEGRAYTVTSTSSITGTTRLKYFTAQMLGLEADEWITEFEANVGTFSVSYYSGSSSASRSSDNVSTYGKLSPGISDETTTMSIYDPENRVATEVVQSNKVVNSETATKTTVTNSFGSFKDKAKQSISQVIAGDSFAINATIGVHSYQYGTTTAVKAPEIYLREPKGMSIAIDTLVIKNENNQVVEDWSYTTYQNSQQDVIYKITTSDSTFIGNYFGIDASSKTLQLDYMILTSVKTVGYFDMRDLIGWGKTGLVATPGVGAATPPRLDTYDFNGNGITDEYMLTTSSKGLAIIENKNVLVETFLSLQGEDAKAPYVEGKEDTVAFFTPGTDADYTINVTNNGDAPSSAFIAYVPIPKTGQDFGTSYQAEPFKWDMKLSSIIDDSGLDGKFEVLYSTDATKDNYATTANFTSIAPANLSDITMVKLQALQPLLPTETAIVKIQLKVDETFESASAGNKIGERNVYNPVYDVVSPTFSGTLTATKVGTELVIAEIGGTVFYDSNADGLFKAVDGDTVINGHEVELYKWDETLQKYEAVLDTNSIPVKTTTNNQGIYLFDYTKGLGYGKYAIKFVEKNSGTYQYTIHNPSNRDIDSDAIIANNLPNSGDQYKGWVLDIDATKPTAKTIGAGFIAYNPPIDLRVDITKSSTSIKMSNTQQTINELLAYTVSPTFFDTIKNPTNAYTWSSSNPAIVSVTNGSITGLQVGNATITLTIKDVYGNTTSDTIEVTVESNNIPIITAVDTTIEASNTIFNPLTLVTANDIEDESLIIEVVENTVISNKIGTYKVTYSVTDSDNNVVTKTINIIVQDTISPIVTINVDKSINPTSVTALITEITESIITWEVVDANNNKTTGTGASVTLPTVDGVYTANIKVVDEAGNEANATSNFKIDRTAPNLQATTTGVTIEATLNSVPTDWQTVFGVSSVDSLDGDITQDVVYTVDPLLTAMNVPGTYSILANSTDAVGNSAPTLTLTYTITHTSLPVLSATETVVQVEASRNPLPTNWQAIFDVEASDIVDGNITNDVTYTVDPLLTSLSVPGTYTILANVKNSADTAAATLTLTYRISDTIAPNLTATMTAVNIEASLNELPTNWGTVFGVSSVDLADGDITDTIIYSVDPLLTAMNIPGTYTILANSTDVTGNSAPTLTLTYTIVHTSLPVITAAETAVTVEASNDSIPTNWQTIFGVAATDIVDGDITATIDYTVDPLLTAMNNPGSYTILANVTNSADMIATTKVLTYNIEDTIKPILTTAIDSVTVKTGTAQPTDWITLFGITATDTLDGDIIASLQATPEPTTIDMNTVGTTIITLSVADRAGNTTTKEVSFKIEPITLSGTVFSDENYDGTADEQIGLAGIEVELFDPLTTAVLMSTTTDNEGAYNFEGVTLGSNLVIRVQTPTGYLLAPMSNTSLINPDTGTSNSFTITTADQTNLNIGFAPEYIIHISPTEKAMYLGKTASLDVHVEHGSVSSVTWQQGGIATVATTSTGYLLTSTAVGTDYIILTIADGYGRETTKTRTVPITVTESSLTTDQSTQEAIMAKPFIIKEAAIETMQLANYIEQAKAKAWSIAPATLNQPVEITSMSSLSTARDTTQEVTFATAAGTYITLDVVVSTQDNINDYQEVTTGDVELLAANNKVETYDFVDTLETLDDETLRTWSDVNLFNSELSITNMSVQNTAFERTQTERIMKMSGTYPVAFTTRKGGEITSYTTIKHPDSHIIENGEQQEIIEAKDIEIDINTIATLTAETIDTLAQVDAWKTRTWTNEGLNERVDYQVDYSNIQAQVGRYPVQYTTSNGTTLEIMATVAGEKTTPEETATQEQPEETKAEVLPTTGLNTMFYLLLGGAITILSIILLFTKKKVKKLR